LKVNIMEASKKKSEKLPASPKPESRKQALKLEILAALAKKQPLRASTGVRRRNIVPR